MVNRQANFDRVQSHGLCEVRGQNDWDDGRQNVREQSKGVMHSFPGETLHTMTSPFPTPPTLSRSELSPQSQLRYDSRYVRSHGSSSHHGF